VHFVKGVDTTPSDARKPILQSLKSDTAHLQWLDRANRCCVPGIFLRFPTLQRPVLLLSAKLKNRAAFQGGILQNQHVSSISGMPGFSGFYPRSNPLRHNTPKDSCRCTLIKPLNSFCSGCSLLKLAKLAYISVRYQYINGYLSVFS